ncbi:hypothetical protein [Conexibacter sp. W3-3-2]|uniref:hypothetical protein n=1 Tax=Conexibacter sp. W3-3-2 TaxID=2675227 RepID=UPI0018AADB74|nr:hypothetical protein [Conexibacter sp. W3-3-2]
MRERAGERGAGRGPVPGVVAAVGCLVLAGCGAQPSGDVDERAATYEVEVVRAAFPEQQRVSLTSDLVLTVRNRGDRDLPELAVTVWTGNAGVEAPKPEKPFSLPAADARAGDRAVAVWVPTPGFPKIRPAGAADDAALARRPDGGAEVAQTDTFAFGPLAAGATRTVVWRVTAVRAGRYRLNYAVAAGLAGRARAVDATGATPAGRLPVRITAAPSGCVVDDSGRTSGDCDD